MEFVGFANPHKPASLTMSQLDIIDGFANSSAKLCNANANLLCPAHRACFCNGVIIDKCASITSPRIFSLLHLTAI